MRSRMEVLRFPDGRPEVMLVGAYAVVRRRFPAGYSLLDADWLLQRFSFQADPIEAAQELSRRADGNEEAGRLE
jgi:hypothetical protein